MTLNICRPWAGVTLKRFFKKMTCDGRSIYLGGCFGCQAVVGDGGHCHVDVKPGNPQCEVHQV